MNKAVGIFIIILVIGGLYLMVSNNPNIKAMNIQDEIQRKAKMVGITFDTGEYIGFDVKPSRDIDYEQKLANRPTTIHVEETSDGIVSNIDPDIPTSDVELFASDRANPELVQSCKQGYQCDITGRITLLDPVTGDIIPAPYHYLLEIDCDYRDWCTLSPSIAKNDFTDSSGSFRHTWVTSGKITLGEYRVTVMTISEHLDSDGKQIRLEFSKYINIT